MLTTNKPRKPLLRACPTKPRCRCGRVRRYYGLIGGWSKKCRRCNEGHARRQIGNRAKLKAIGRVGKRHAPLEVEALRVMREKFGTECLFCTLDPLPGGIHCRHISRVTPDGAHIYGKQSHPHIKFHPLNRLPLGREHHDWAGANPKKALGLMLDLLTVEERGELENARKTRR